MTNAAIQNQWREDFAPFRPGAAVTSLVSILLHDATLPVGSEGRIEEVRSGMGGYKVRFGKSLAILAHDELCDGEALYQAA